MIKPQQNTTKHKSCPRFLGCAEVSKTYDCFDIYTLLMWLSTYGRTEIRQEYGICTYIQTEQDLIRHGQYATYCSAYLPVDGYVGGWAISNVLFRVCFSVHGKFQTSGGLFLIVLYWHLPKHLDVYHARQLSKAAVNYLTLTRFGPVVWRNVL